MPLDDIGGGSDVPSDFRFKLVNTHGLDFLEHVRSSLSRGLQEVGGANPAHQEVLSIIGGGPSLEDTWKQIRGYAAAINGSLSFLLSKGVVPQMCGICHPTESIVDIVEAHPDVGYFVASHCHPKLFDKLLKAGCKVYLWHNHPIDGLDDLLRELRPQGWAQISGGCTMGTRWLPLGYHLGFREFDCHGMDSSFRGKSSHAYPDEQDGKEWVYFDGYPTRVPFIGQVGDFLGLMDDARESGMDPIEVKLYGEGLLQSQYAKWQKKNPPFIWPDGDVVGKDFIPAEARNIAEFVSLIPNRGTCVQAGGNVGVYPRRLAREFKKVITFEPDKANYDCLVENVRNWKNIEAHRVALGSTEYRVNTYSHEAGNSGAVVVGPGSDVPMVAIDSLGLTECDLIWLDVEGYEVRALMGAADTVETFKPAVIIEENDSGRKLHAFEADAASKWLKERNYFPVLHRGNDCLYVYGGPC